jgi:hypothetical protein
MSKIGLNLVAVYSCSNGFPIDKELCLEKDKTDGYERKCRYFCYKISENLDSI